MIGQQQPFAGHQMKLGQAVLTRAPNSKPSIDQLAQCREYSQPRNLGFKPWYPSVDCSL
jgi:hypothetical protein